MTLLAIDTAANLCAACIYAERELGRAVIDIGKGHAEQLIPVIRQALAAAGCGFGDLTAMAVTVGPGSFTGIRVGVAAARGFALALKIPAVGVTTLEGLAAESRESYGAQPVLAALDAGRGELHAALYGIGGEVLAAAAVFSLQQAAALARLHRPMLTGTAAEMIRDAAGGLTMLDIASHAATADIGVYARLALARRENPAKPVPLYLRGADAKPQAGFVLPRRQA